MGHPKAQPFSVIKFLNQQGLGRNLSTYRENQIVYEQGEPANSVFYTQRGKVKVTVVSQHGKQAIIALRGPDEFSGEGAIIGEPVRLATVTATSTCEIIRLEKKTIVQLLRNEPRFAEHFLSHLLTRTARVEADLVDHLFNSSELRLARTLLLLANHGNDASAEPTPIKMNQGTLAEMIGTTRGRVNAFMNKFRKLGLIDYNGKIHVHKTLLNYVLHKSMLFLVLMPVTSTVY
jgi:CRP-like cAMP-binding protein